MSEATNFKNNKTGQQIDLVDQNARDQITELNETLTEWGFLNERGVAITSGGDLNDYKTPGKYYSTNSSATESLLNCPYTGTGITLIVMRLYNTIYLAQIIIGAKQASSKFVYLRIFGNDWQNWYVVNLTQTD